MGVFGQYGLTVAETKKKRALEKTVDVGAPIPPELEHTTIDRLVKMGGEYDFVVSLSSFCTEGCCTFLRCFQSGDMLITLLTSFILVTSRTPVRFDVRLDLSFWDAYTQRSNRLTLSPM